MTSFAETVWAQCVKEKADHPPLTPERARAIIQDNFDRAVSALTSIPQKPKSSHLTVTSDCHLIYALFPRHIGKEAALKAIAKAIAKAGVEKLVIAVNRYKFCTDRWKKEDRQYIPHPATWFNEGRYDDDQSEWEKGGAPSEKPKISLYVEPDRWTWTEMARKLWPDATIHLLEWRDVSHTCKTEIHSKIYP